jgi:hypothetical protein
LDRRDDRCARDFGVRRANRRPVADGRLGHDAVKPGHGSHFDLNRATDINALDRHERGWFDDNPSADVDTRPG